MPAMIEVENLVKRYKGAETNAVDGISLEVQPGQFLALLGPNGAGKTTTISILTTTLEPTSGRALIAGHDIVRQSAAVRRSIGVIFQKPSLDTNLTAEENVRFHAILYGLFPFRPAYSLMPRAYKQQVHELAALVGIEHEIFRPIKTFSGGMKRKLEIVRTLMHRPPVLFLDEPTTGLDPESRRNLWRYLRQVQAEQGTTILLTTHYLDEAEDVDCVCIINKGQIVSYGTPAQVKADLIDAYLLLDADDRGALRSELGALGLAFSEQPLFKVGLCGKNIHQILKSIQTPLSVVQTHVPSLEDAYLEIVRRGDTNGA